MKTRSFIGVLSCCCLAALLHAQPAVPPDRPPSPIGAPLGAASVAPALEAAAARDGILLRGVPKAEHGASTVGDSVVLGIGASDGKQTWQWLIQMRRAAPTPKEEKSRGHDVTRYLSWGTAVTFKSVPDTLALWIAGPVNMSDASAAASTEPAPVKRLRVQIPGDYLRLGLDDYARIHLQLMGLKRDAEKSSRKLDFGHLYSLAKPVEPENVKWAKPVADQIGFTPEMERAWAGGHVAVTAYYEMISDIPDLRAIATIAVEQPSVFSLAKMALGTTFQTGLGGDHARAVDPAAIGLMPVGLEAFALPFHLQFGEKPMVAGEFVVTKPVPPLDVSAGILGLIAVNPRDPKKKVHIVMLGAQRDPGRSGL